MRPWYPGVFSAQSRREARQDLEHGGVTFLDRGTCHLCFIVGGLCVLHFVGQGELPLFPRSGTDLIYLLVPQSPGSGKND